MRNAIQLKEAGNNSHISSYKIQYCYDKLKLGGHRTYCRVRRREKSSVGFTEYKDYERGSLVMIVKRVFYH